MSAKQLSFFKTKLMGISRDLYIEHGWKMPGGIERAGNRNPTNFSLAEWQQAKRAGVDPRQLKETVQLCWNSSDNLRAFQAALAGNALTLAKGDRRGAVIVDFTGEVHALTRQLDLKTKDVAPRLARADLPSVAQARGGVAKKLTPNLRAHIKEARSQFESRASKLGKFKTEMTTLHRDERAKLDQRHAVEWDAETRARSSRLPKGLRGLWHRITGKYQQVRALNEAEAEASLLRQRAARDELVARQLRERTVLQDRIKEQRKSQAQLLQSLRRDLSHALGFTKEAGKDLTRRESLGLKLERS
jgi:hypothetical protein